MEFNTNWGYVCGALFLGLAIGSYIGYHNADSSFDERHSTWEFELGNGSINGYVRNTDEHRIIFTPSNDSTKGYYIDIVLRTQGAE